MYMFYILGYEFASITDSQEQKETIASKTFILSVDGDTGFQPDALQKLIDTLRENEQVGAICGRIHPKGSGIFKLLSLFKILYFNSNLLVEMCKVG